jgi:hypothetical protein
MLRSAGGTKHLDLKAKDYIEDIRGEEVRIKIKPGRQTASY